MRPKIPQRKLLKENVTIPIELNENWPAMEVSSTTSNIFIKLSLKLASLEHETGFGILLQHIIIPLINACNLLNTQ